MGPYRRFRLGMVLVTWLLVFLPGADFANAQPQVIAVIQAAGTAHDVDVNPVTNRIYVAGLFDDVISVIEGKKLDTRPLHGR